jgi:hypothetical protein
MVALAARRKVATSEGGGRPSRQSRPERLAYHQYPFMLPLEVVGPGGSLSTVLIASPIGEMPVGGCIQLRPDGCGARPSAGDGGRWRRKSDRFRRRRMLNLIIVFGLFFRMFNISYIRPFYVFVFGLFHT